MKQGYLTMRSIGHYGRLANMAYQVAGVLGIAKKNNLEPVFEPFRNHDHKERFGSTEDIDLQKYFEHPLPSIPEGIVWLSEHPLPWGFSDVVLRPGNHNISGHMQSWKFFDNCRDQVAHYFRMHDEPPISDYVGLHVRLTDYCGGYHPRLDMRYYGKALEFFPASQRVLVFSDDITAAKAMFGSAPQFDYSEGNDYIQDWKLMKRCASFVIGNSSYSAMAATLGESPDKIVVAPRPWFGWQYAHITGDDIYEPSWKLVQWE